MSEVPPKHAPLDWLFIDVGGVLLDDRPLLDALYRYVADALQRRGVDTGREEVLATRRRLVAAGVDGVYRRVLREHAPDRDTADEVLAEFREWLEPRQKELNPPREGVREALAALSDRYRLALAANQGAYIHDLLAEHELRRYFDEAAISGEIGVAKPDPAFFRHLLSACETTPGRAAMVGDSLPNDLRPAHELGMRTVRVIAGGDNVPGDEAYGFATGTVEGLHELPALLASWQGES